MDPEEFIELIIAARSGIGGHVANFITALFAYLLVAHFVANRLRSLQLWGISLIYSVYAYLPANAAFQDINTLGGLLEQFAIQHPTEAGIYVQYGQGYPIGWTIIALVSWGLSIWFMIQQRTRKSRNDA